MFPKIGVPQKGWFIMENPIKVDDLGVPLFSETSKCIGAYTPSTPWHFNQNFLPSRECERSPPESRGKGTFRGKKPKENKNLQVNIHVLVYLPTFTYIYDMFTFKIKAWTFISITYPGIPPQKKHVKFQRANYRSPLVKDYDSRSSFSPPVTFRADGPPMKTTTLRQSVLHEKIIAMNNKTCTFAEICRERWMLFLPYYFRFGRLYFFLGWPANESINLKKKDAKRLYQHWSPCTSAVQVLENKNCFDIGGWWVSPCWIGLWSFSDLFIFSVCLTRETPDVWCSFSFSCMFFRYFFDVNKEKRLTFNNEVSNFHNRFNGCFTGGGKNNVWFKLGFASNTPPKFKDSSWKMMVGRLLSYWEGLFSWASS